jgi:predicted HAD superfamily Cof-like phosphohydrolase
MQVVDADGNAQLLIPGLSQNSKGAALTQVERDEKFSQVFKSEDEHFNAVKKFHLTFDGATTEKPTAFSSLDASHRAGFKAEELVEFLYATANNDEEKFKALVDQLKRDVDKAVDKILRKNETTESVLVGQVDALTDLLYFVYGSFVLSGVDPEPIFKIVHEANMGKVFPDGSVHFDEQTHKILKPANWEQDFAPEGKIKKEIDKQKEERK